MYSSDCSKNSWFGRLSAIIVLSTVITSPALAQYMGPMQPQKPPMQETKVTRAIEKLLKKKNAGKDKAAPNATEATDVNEKAPPSLDDSVSDQAEEMDPKAAKAAEKDMLPGVMAIPQRGPILAQPPLTTAKIEATQIDAEHPPILDHPKLDDPTNPLGLVEAQNRLKKCATLIEAKRYIEAKPGLSQLRQWLVDVTEAHISLYKTLNQIPSARAQAELEKTLALEFAQLRDRAMVENAKIYIADKEYPKAVKELTEVIKSQPKSKVGLRSYEMLQEIGFTEKLQLAQ